MPNYCDYKMKIRGNRENRDKWLDKMESYDEDNHFWRIFDVYVDAEPDSYITSGTCAWSIESCCRASGYSEGVDLFAVNSKDLDLVVEVWSEESEGCFFQEHYVYNRGKCVIAECRDFEIYWWDKDEFEDFEDWKREMDVEGVKEEDFDADGYYREGGFGQEWGEWTI